MLVAEPSEGVTPAEPAPARPAAVYSLPLAYAFGNCPNPRCARQFRFSHQPGRAEQNGRHLRCAGCGTVIGRYVVMAEEENMVWLRVVCAT